MFSTPTGKNSLISHKLKTWPGPFKAVVNGTKCHEVRNDDGRNFKVGDRLLLAEWDPDLEQFTGKLQDVLVTYLTQWHAFGLPPRMVVMSIIRLRTKGA